MTESRLLDYIETRRERDSIEHELDELNIKYEEESQEIIDRINKYPIDDKLERIYNTSKYAIDNFRNCKHMGIFEAYKYFIELDKKYEKELHD